MTKFIKTTFAALAILSIAGPASAQDNFSVTIKQTSGVPVEANYAAMAKQAKRFCDREGSRVDGRGLHQEARKFSKKCVIELMDKTIQQIQDPVLTAYHRYQNTARTAVATNTPTNTSEDNSKR